MHVHVHVQDACARAYLRDFEGQDVSVDQLLRPNFDPVHAKSIRALPNNGFTNLYFRVCKSVTQNNVYM